MGDPVESISLQTLVADIDDNNMILKMDCEGSEFDIVLNSSNQLLRRFQSIHMELHANCNENPHYHDPELVRNKLTSAGFVQVWKNPVVLFNAQYEIVGHMDIWVEKWIRT
jgi:hypothetical protein